MVSLRRQKPSNAEGGFFSSCIVLEHGLSGKIAFGLWITPKAGLFPERAVTGKYCDYAAI
jgi:hypothetical protein